MEVNPYIALAINGFFTGIGVIIAQHFNRLWLEKSINKVTKKLKKKHKIIKRSESGLRYPYNNPLQKCKTQKAGPYTK